MKETLDTPDIMSIPKNPFKFLESYTKEERGLFEGRDSEIERLYELAHSSNSLLIFGESGVGKTSLIQCGLANRFQKTDWLDVWIYRKENINISFRDTLLNVSKNTQHDKPGNTVELIRYLYLKYFKPVYLIFDQLEELFILGSDNEKNVFFQELTAIHNENLCCKFIFIIREEFHARLHEMSKYLPSIFKNSIKINRMGLSNALKVAEKTIIAANVVIEPSIRIVTQLVIDACKGKNDTVNLSDLQVFLYMLWKKAYQKEGIVRLNEKLIIEVGKVEDVLKEYLEECVSECLCATNTSHPEQVWAFLRQFVTSNGTTKGSKKPTKKADISGFNDAEVDCWLSILEKKKIIRSIGTDETLHELSHDSLAPLILEKKLTKCRQKLKSPILKGNPYKGLIAYEEGDKAQFFGRTAMTDALFERAIKEALIAVVGSSGAGKSSLIKAGLIPRLKESGYRVLSAKPGNDPLHTIKYLLSEITETEKYVIYIDQFEELSTRCENLHSRQAFISFLHSLIKAQHHIILSIRADYEHEFDKHFREWRTGKMIITPLKDEEIREIIYEPAYLAGLEFQPDYLVDIIINDVKHSSGTLPLLSYTLSQMYEEYAKSGRDDFKLTETDYNRLGGVVDGLRSRANEIYDLSDAWEQRTIRNVMLRMVALGINEKAGKRILESDLEFESYEENKRVITILEKFIEKRLIITGRDNNNNKYYEPAHDSLIRTWEVIGNWIERYGKEILFLQKKLTDAIANYESDNSLWDENPRLDILKVIVDSDDNWLNIHEMKFVKTSLDKRDLKLNEKKEIENRKKKFLRYRLRIVSTFSSITLLLSVLLFFNYAETLRKKEEVDSLNNDLRAANRIAIEEKGKADAEAAESFRKSRTSRGAELIANEESRKVMNALDKLRRQNILLGTTLRNLNIEREKNRLAQQSGNWLGLAQTYEKIMPSLSYRLTELSLNYDPANISTRDFYTNLSESKGFYETLILKDAAAASFSENGELLLSVNPPLNLNIWNMEGNPIGHHISSSPIIAATFSPTNQSILLQTEEGLSIHDLSGKEVIKVQGDYRKTINVKFSNDGSSLIAILPEEIQILSLQGIPLLKIPNTFYDKLLGVQDIQISKQRILAKSNNQVLIYNSISGLLIREFSSTNVYLLPDAKGFITWDNKKIQIFDDNGNLIKDYKLNELPPNYNTLESMCLSRDGSGILLVFSKSLTLRRAISLINSVNTSSPDNRELFTCVLNLQTENMVQITGNYGSRAMLSSNGQNILTGEAGYIETESLTNRQQYSRILFGESTLYNSWHFNPVNTNVILTQSQDKGGVTTKLWTYGLPGELDQQGKLKKFTPQELIGFGIK